MAFQGSGGLSAADAGAGETGTRDVGEPAAEEPAAEEPAAEEATGASDTERLVFFSDAVIAIAITLLALDLPLPSGRTNREVWHALGDGRDEYLAFLISFLVIWSQWAGHRRMFRAVRLGGRLALWNMLWLLMIVVTPFATRVITGDGAFESRFTLYATVQALAGLCSLLIVREVDRGGLRRSEDARSAADSGYLRALTVVVAFGISIPVAWFTHWAFACWALLAVLPRIGAIRAARRTRSAPALP